MTAHTAQIMEKIKKWPAMAWFAIILSGVIAAYTALTLLSLVWLLVKIILVVGVAIVCIRIFSIQWEYILRNNADNWTFEFLSLLHQEFMH